MPEKPEKNYSHKTNFMKKIHFSQKKKTVSFENLVEDEELEDLPEEEEHEEAEDQHSRAHELGNTEEQQTDATKKKKKKPKWKRGVRWARKHVRFRKWMIRGLENMGNNLRYASPMAAPSMFANDINRTMNKYARGTNYNLYRYGDYVA